MRVKNSLSAISSFSPKKKKKNRAQELREHVHHIYRAYERREKEGEKGKKEPISKFVRVLIKRDCVANGRKGGNRSGDGRRKGAPPRLDARVPFDFAIFIGEIEHNVDARSVGVRVDRWTPPSLPNAILERENAIKPVAIGDLSRETWPTNERNGLARSRKIGARVKTHPPWLWVEAGNLSHDYIF